MPDRDLQPCPDCGHPLSPTSQLRCTECGLPWADWMSGDRSRLRMTGRDWLLLLVVVPIVVAIPPLLAARGAVTGARTFESSYLLTIPGFAGIGFLAWWYATPVVWWLGRARRRRGLEPKRPCRIPRLLCSLVLILGLSFLFLLVIRIGYVLFVQPLRPPPGPVPVLGSVEVPVPGPGAVTVPVLVVVVESERAVEPLRADVVVGHLERELPTAVRPGPRLEAFDHLPTKPQSA